MAEKVKDLMHARRRKGFKLRREVSDRAAQLTFFSVKCKLSDARSEMPFDRRRRFQGREEKGRLIEVGFYVK